MKFLIGFFLSMTVLVYYADNRIAANKEFAKQSAIHNTYIQCWSGDSIVYTQWTDARVSLNGNIVNDPDNTKTGDTIDISGNCVVTSRAQVTSQP